MEDEDDSLDAIEEDGFTTALSDDTDRKLFLTTPYCLKRNMYMST